MRSGDPQNRVAYSTLSGHGRRPSYPERSQLIYQSKEILDSDPDQAFESRVAVCCRGRQVPVSMSHSAKLSLFHHPITLAITIFQVTISSPLEKPVESYWMSRLVQNW
ncbi:hypothetical protein N7539_002073 [Penicillium diatomitis]|uniref:Uncharacterized protein n=1 Tax=Penicillium diatomitis TaxID=2819901 RepID=A0A9X0C090_9EURO|nr:uncharacterized protein N7539_002073 [Penicillium diatomitis]KAJ5493327.1 hypothetical protein N7539_002073 [Penicillium diatomitis]